MNRVWAYIIQDYPRKLLALLFAVMLYLGVSGKIFETKSLPGVPVEVTLSPDLIFATGQKNQVTVTVQGSERTLKAINPEDFTGSVYVGPEHGIGGDVYVVHLRPDMFKHRTGAKVVKCQPLRLHLQRRISKRVQVKVQFSGRLSEEFRSGEVRCIPAEVMVSGPELTLNSFNTMFTEPIPLSETVRDSFEFESKLIVPADLQVNPGRVMVQVDIAKNLEQRRFAGLPVRLMSGGDASLKAALEGAARTADVLVSGGPARLSVLTKDDIRLYADLSDIRQPGIYTVPLRSNCTVEGVSVKAVTPGEVKVKVVKLP